MPMVASTTMVCGEMTSLFEIQIWSKDQKLIGDDGELHSEYGTWAVIATAEPV
jgi:hypothetical protein